MTEKTNNLDRYTLLTRVQAAKYLGISKGTLSIWSSKRIHLPYIKVGSRVQYRLSDLKDFIDKKAQTSEDVPIAPTLRSTMT